MLLTQCYGGQTIAIPVAHYIPKLLMNLGMDVAAQALANYLSDRFKKPDPIHAQLEEINQMMAKAGFTDIDSKVYIDTQNFSYYANHENDVDACLVFATADKESNNWITMLEGPSILGMAWATEEIIETDSESKARELIYPVKDIHHSKGDLEQGYSRPTKYTNRSGGITEIDYNKTGRNDGVILVDAQGPGLTYKKEFTINSVA